MPIARTATGLLFHDEFTRADGQLIGDGTWLREWVSGPDSEWQIVGDLIRCTPTTVNGGGIVYPPTIARAKPLCIQAFFHRLNSQGRVGISLWDHATGKAFQCLRDPVNGWELWRCAPSFSLVQTSTTGEVELGTLKAVLTAGNIKFYQGSTLLFNRADTLLDAVTPGGGPTVAPNTAGGITANNKGEFDNVVYTAGTVVTMTGLTPGQIMKIGGLSAVADGTGTATLDIASVIFPAADIELYEADGVTLVDSLVPTLAGAPDGVWGGDTFHLNILPDTPVLAVVVTDPPVTLNGSAYVGHPATDVQDSAEWQIATADDPTFAAPVFDSGFDALHLQSLTVTGLTEGIGFLARVRYRSAALLVSDWSASIAFGPLGRWHPADAAPATPWSGGDAPVSSDWVADDAAPASNWNMADG